MNTFGVYVDVMLGRSYGLMLLNDLLLMERESGKGEGRRAAGTSERKTGMDR